jgi:hypothetical protein
MKDGALASAGRFLWKKTGVYDNITLDIIFEEGDYCGNTLFNRL